MIFFAITIFIQQAKASFRSEWRTIMLELHGIPLDVYLYVHAIFLRIIFNGIFGILYQFPYPSLEVVFLRIPKFPQTIIDSTGIHFLMTLFRAS
ncbi:MAG TPA: hypothetical protein DC006_05650 [Prevotellaceae bacterium]|nr:hypothetical protein [Prevotellaceae bacterium]